LQPEFARAFADADTLRLLDIYAASEEPIPGVDAKGLVEAIRRTETVSGGVEYVESMQVGAEAVASAAEDGDVVLTLGAGNVSQAGPMVLAALEGVGGQPPIVESRA
jgi:UDP-N-acetylmuramate--alanine ligase